MNRILFILLFIVSTGVNHSSFGYIPVHRKPSRGKLFYKHSRQLVTKENQASSTGSVYQNYFEGIDGQITLMYQNQWNQQEQTLPFRATSWRGEFISNSAQPGTYDWEAREQFARQVFRMRLEQGIKEYSKSLKRSNFISKAQGAIDALKDVSVPVSTKDGKPSAQLRLGYDFITDNSKLEYVGGVVDLGIYKSASLAEPGNTSRTLMNISSDLGADIGRASVSVPLNAENIQASVTRQLSPTLSTSVSSIHGLKESQDTTYRWQLAYSF
ncbi:MAG: hypothetical protein EB078_07205 [Proteobacteria bacterium]|nr:hypothetical protein [Pseudomonadota bacterium]NDC24786.1 hypothetical protein [Pseudomonadota bacterium]NDD04677.1 hypothetical protein [Pseudomonadota bacterium]NDG27681.1 hypothetical protein [Pseudomonadota bacterium]